MSADRPPSASRGMGHSASMPAGLRRGKPGRKSATDNFGSRRSSAMSPPGRKSKTNQHSSHRKPVKLTIRDIVVRVTRLPRRLAEDFAARCVIAGVHFAGARVCVRWGAVECVATQENDTGKRPTSKNLIKGLEENVRKVLETKRNEYDRTHFELQQKQKELAALRLQLGDLAKDGKALGLDEFPNEKERMASIPSISNRKVFTKHTHLSKMVAALEKKKQQIQKVVHTGRIYDHMRHRLMQQRVEEKRINRDLKAELRRRQIKHKELTRDEQAVADALRKAQFRLAQLKKDVERDLFLWRSEIADRESWQKQKQKFEDFVTKQIERQREIELEVQGDLNEEEEEELKAKNAASMFANRHIARKLSQTLKTTTEEERRYEEAFRKIGVKLENLDPKSIIETCLAQDEIRKDLIEKRTLEEERVEDLKKQLAAAQEELNNTMYDQERTTNRVLSDREKELNEAEKQLEAERSEFQFMQATVQPVKIGIQHLAKKVLDVQVDLSDIAEIEWVMNQVQSKLAKIIEETRQDVGTVRSPTPAAAGKSDTPAGVRRTSLSLAGLTDAEENASWLLSPFNVRVQAKKEALEMEEENDGAESARRRPKKRGKHKDHDDGGSDSDEGATGAGVHWWALCDMWLRSHLPTSCCCSVCFRVVSLVFLVGTEDGTNKVHTRSELKRMADILTNRNRKSRHRSSQHSKDAPSAGRRSRRR